MHVFLVRPALYIVLHNVLVYNFITQAHPLIYYIRANQKIMEAHVHSQRKKIQHDNSPKELRLGKLQTG